jgi:hypothetical protein
LDFRLCGQAAALKRWTQRTWQVLAKALGVTAETLKAFLN